MTASHKGKNLSVSRVGSRVSRGRVRAGVW